MKRSSKEIKRISRDILNDRYSVPMGAFVAASFIPMAIEIPFSMSMGNTPTDSQLIITLIAEFLITLVSFVLGCGVSLLHLNMTRSYEFKLSQIFTPFRQRTEKYFGAGFLKALLFLLGCLPVFGGLLYFYFSNDSIASRIVLVLTAVLSLVLCTYLLLTYQFVSLLLLDHPGFRVTDAFKECRLLMKHNRRRLLYLLLSFLGWDALILCSFGLAALWIAPYKNQTFVIFYLDCTGELERIPVRSYR